MRMGNFPAIVSLAPPPTLLECNNIHTYLDTFRFHFIKLCPANWGRRGSRWVLELRKWCRKLLLWGKEQPSNSPHAQLSVVSLCFPQKHRGRNGLGKSTLQPGKIREGVDYNMTLLGRDETSPSYLVADTEIKLRVEMSAVAWISYLTSTHLFTFLYYSRNPNQVTWSRTQRAECIVKIEREQASSSLFFSPKR